MSYYSIFDYMSWYNWYYGITKDATGTVVVERIETPIPVPLAVECETQPLVPLAEVISKKKSTFKNYHLRK